MALKAARKASGKTQEQVALETGVGVRLYQYYEAGEKRPSVDAAIRIAKALGTTVEHLFSAGTDR